MTNSAGGGESPSGEAWSRPVDVKLWDCKDLLGALRAGGAWLDAHIDLVNALNVFPVPDGDTGTNMSLTMRAALAEVANREHPSAGAMAKSAANGALMGARGNSGVILSQILRGFARGLDDKSTVGASDLASALEEGVDTAYKGVMKPVEGTILTVVREAASAASDAAAMGGSLVETLEHAVTEARASLARTPLLLAVLAEAGVVDAGGQGLVYVLEGMLKHTRGEAVDASAVESVTSIHTEMVESDYNYDAQFLIKGADLDLIGIRDRICDMGDSVLVVGDERLIKVHVHTDHPGLVIEYGLTCGVVDDVVIENMQVQFEAFRASGAGVGPGVSPAGLLRSAPLSEIGVIAVASGPGLQKVLESLGVDAIVQGGQTMNPSTQDLIVAIDSISAKKVLLLPNNSNIIMAARQAKELSEKEVAVVPTKTVPQGIAALLAFNYQASLEENCAAMTDASGTVETLEVTQAVRTTQVNGLSITEGQLIGLVNGALTLVGDELVPLILELLEHVSANDYEVVTVFYGEDVTQEEAEALGAHLEGAYPDLEIEVLEGGQAHYYYVISVE